MSRIGTRKRKRAKDSPVWIGSIPIGTYKGSYKGLEMAQEQSRILANRLLRPPEEFSKVCYRGIIHTQG